MEFNFANVPVNPFASTDALMSYLYYDKNRFKPAHDSDCTEESSEDEEDGPSSGVPGQKTLEPDDYSENSNRNSMLHTNNSLANGHVASIHDASGTENEESISTENIESSSEKLAKKSIESSKNIISKNEDLEITRNTGTKPKTLVKNKTSHKNKDTNHLEAKITNGDDNGDTRKLTNGRHVIGDDSILDPTVVEGEKVIKKKVKKLKRKKRAYDPSEVQCNKCNRFIDRNYLREYRSAISFTMQRLKDLQEDNPSILYLQLAPEL